MEGFVINGEGDIKGWGIVVSRFSHGAKDNYSFVIL